MLFGVRLGFAALIAVLLTGCVVGSDRPIYDARRDTVFDPRLLGTWRCSIDLAGQEGLHDLRIERDGARRYCLTIPATQPSDPPPQPVAADLVPLGKYRYLFMTTGQETGTILFPCYRVTVGCDEMRLWLLNVAELAGRLEANPKLLPHREVSLSVVVNEVPKSQTQPTTRPLWQSFVLTGDPAQIRRYLVAHQDDPDEFTAPLVFKRAAGP